MITPTEFHTRLRLGNPEAWKAALALYRKATGNPSLREMATVFNAHYSTVAHWLRGDSVPTGMYRKVAVQEVERIILPLLVQERENEILKGALNDPC